MKQKRHKGEESLVMKSGFDLSDRPSQLRFEQGGMLVYDVKATMCRIGEHLREKQEAVLHDRCNFVQAHVKGLRAEDLELLKKVRALPPTPCFPASYTLFIPNDQVTLELDSKFECGNLFRAIKLSDYEYNLYIQPDYNTTGNNHWYYFSAMNPRKTSITFNIVNMKRPDLLYKSGQKPAVFSTKLSKELNINWHRDGNSISYSPSGDFYTLSFTYSYKYEGDTVFFAYSIPYSYTDLQHDLKEMQLKHKDCLRIDTLCSSLAGNNCYILTITEDVKSFMGFSEEQSDWNTSIGGRRLRRMKKVKTNAADDEKHRNKRTIVLTARVHSGETVSSFMMRGALNFLVGESRGSKMLRKSFVFKVIPMLNPDGVRYGSFRCSLLGVDLNRRWDDPHKILHPTIYYAKKMIQVINETHKVVIFCDMHGHTRKKNVFMYGCSDKSKDFLAHRKNLLTKFIPVLMAKSNKFFSYRDSHFRMEKDKLSTARVVMYNFLEIPHSYTIEASFFGPKLASAFGENYMGDMHMSEKNLESVGESLCKIFLNFLNESVFYSKLRAVNECIKDWNAKKRSEKEGEVGTEVKEEEIEIDENIEREEVETIKFGKDEQSWNGISFSESESESDSGGSESCPSEHEYVIKKSKTTFKRREITPIKKSPSNMQFKGIQQAFSEVTSERQKDLKNFQSKSILVPKIIVPKIAMPKNKINIPIVSPKFNGSSNKIVVPPLKYHFPHASMKPQPFNKINRSKDGIIKESNSYIDTRCVKPSLTPRNYKLYNLSWVGPNAKEAARRYASNIRFLADRICNKLLD